MLLCMWVFGHVSLYIHTQIRYLGLLMPYRKGKLGQIQGYSYNNATLLCPLKYFPEQQRGKWHEQTMGVDLLLSIMLANAIHHAWCSKKRLELPRGVSSKAPFSAEILSLDDSFIVSFHCSKTVYCRLMNFSLISEICSKYVKASIKKMCMLNLIFGLGVGPEFLGFLNLAFHSNRLENFACFCHSELLDYPFFFPFAIFLFLGLSIFFLLQVFRKYCFIVVMYIKLIVLTISKHFNYLWY